MTTADQPHASNCFRCPHCGGPVDRYEHCFECRDCGALGDLVMGIMTRLEDLSLPAATAARVAQGQEDKEMETDV